MIQKHLPGTHAALFDIGSDGGKDRGWQCKIEESPSLLRGSL